MWPDENREAPSALDGDEQIVLAGLQPILGSIVRAAIAAGGSLLADHAVHEAIERKYSISGEFSLKLRK